MSLLRYLNNHDIRLPIRLIHGTILGMVSFGQLTRERDWNETILNRLKLVGEVLADALAHTRADQALGASREESRQLAGRLLTAQEDERRRLGREMHDDVTQRLAATAITAGKFEQQFLAADPSREAMASLKDQLIELSDDVHRISRQLHPALLDEFLDLEVRDFGCGFFPAEVRGQPGLGLASMEERTRLVGGEITIASVPSQGTFITVRVPLPEDDA